MTFSETFLVFLLPLVVFWGVKFGFRKSCLCKRNDKYKVWLRMSFLPVIFFRLQFHGSSYFFSWNWTTITMNKKIKRCITMSTAYDPIDNRLTPIALRRYQRHAD